MKTMMTLPSKQKGSLLLVTLVLIVLMTIVGLSASVSTMLETRLAANQYDQMMAFQAAESALREGEDYIISTAIDDSLFVDAPDFSSPVVPNPADQRIWNQIIIAGPPVVLNWWSSDPFTSWWEDVGYEITDPTADFTAQYADLPRYVIEYVTEVPSDPGAFSNGTGDGGIAKTYYRVTARGVGVTNNNVVILQSIFERK